MEGLNGLIMKANQEGWIKGFKVLNNVSSNLEITHLLYVDDSLVFCDTDEEQVSHLRMILSLKQFQPCI